LIQQQQQQEKRDTVVIGSVQNTITSFNETNTNTTNSILLQRSQIEFKEIEVQKELGEGSYSKTKIQTEKF
jgi:hypothetical protein